MKKNIDRILIMFGFLAMLLMIFFMCAETGKTEPFIRTYDLIQDGDINNLKNFTDSIQDGSGDINAKSINVVDTLVVDNQVISGSISILGETIIDSTFSSINDGEYDAATTDWNSAVSVLTLKSLPARNAGYFVFDLSSFDNIQSCTLWFYTQQITGVPNFTFHLTSDTSTNSDINTNSIYNIGNIGDPSGWRSIAIEDVLKLSKGLNYIKIYDNNDVREVSVGAFNGLWPPYLEIGYKTTSNLVSKETLDLYKTQVSVDTTDIKKYTDSIQKGSGDIVAKNVIADTVITKILIESNFNNGSINNKILETNYNFPVADNFSGNVWDVSNQTELENAITKASDFDIINLISDITLTSTVNINKTLKFTGKYRLSNSTNTTMLNITADNVYITSDITIYHNVVSNVGSAVVTNAENFVSEARVEFSEFAYSLRGSFNISGHLEYIAATSNPFRNISVYRLDNPSIIHNLSFDFPETNSITNCKFLTVELAVDTYNFNSLLKLENIYQTDKTKGIHQFINLGDPIKINYAGLWVENCRFNANSGDIFLYTSTGNFDLLNDIILLNNYSGRISTRYKGLFFIDGGGSYRSIGENVNFYSFGNNHNQISGDRIGEYEDVFSDYKGLLTYKKSLFYDSGLIERKSNLPITNAIYNYTNDIPSKNKVEGDLLKKLNISDSVTKISQLKNDSNFISYNDTLFFQVINTDTIYSDTSISDTYSLINDTACFIIYGNSYGIILTDFDYSYKINVNGYWVESSQLVYFDTTNNRIVFKADINTFSPNTIKFNFWRVKK